MARGHLFVIVVLLAAAAVAGVLAVSRTAHSQPTSAADPAIAFRLKKLDRLEASLERKLARPTTPAKKSAAPVVVYQRAPSPVVSESHHGDDDGYEASFDDESGRDD